METERLEQSLTAGTGSAHDATAKGTTHSFKGENLMESEGWITLVSLTGQVRTGEKKAGAPLAQLAL